MIKRTMLALVLGTALHGQALAQGTEALEEQVRQLTGRIEEMSFQLLQMEERMRKMQEDNEFRFQELEDASDAKPEKPKEKSSTEGGESLGKPETVASATDDGTGEPTEPEANEPEAGKSREKRPEAAPRQGTLTFDADGKLKAGPGLDAGDNAGRPALPKPPTSPFETPSEAAFAAAAFGSTPDAVFARGRELYRAGDFAQAAEAFRAHAGAWPKDAREAAARYWMGQSLFQSGEFYDAAAALLDAHNRFPDAGTAPDALLALGLSLAGLEQREVACATYAEVLKRYPEAKARLGEQVAAEQASTRC